MAKFACSDRRADLKEFSQIQSIKMTYVRQTYEKHVFFKSNDKVRIKSTYVHEFFMFIIRLLEKKENLRSNVAFSFWKYNSHFPQAATHIVFPNSEA